MRFLFHIDFFEMKWKHNKSHNNIKLFCVLLHSVVTEQCQREVDSIHFQGLNDHAVLNYVILSVYSMCVQYNLNAFGKKIVGLYGQLEARMAGQ